jgi:predicted NBD/HSP70 family sugar kinase
MGSVRIKVARGLLLHGEQIRDGALSRRRFLDEIGVDNGTLRSAAGKLGVKLRDPGVRFFQSEKSRIGFGPGAGLALGVSLGFESLRATLVDANGECRVRYEGEPMPGQLAEPPEILLDRIRHGAGAVLAQAYGDEALTVNGAVPFLGLAVAWPTPLTRGKLPVGHALEHHAWRSGTPVTHHVASHLGIHGDRSHALNDAAAAAVAVAYEQTNRREHLEQRHPRMLVTLRVAGGIGSGMVVIEPPQDDAEFGRTSGFAKSVLIGGTDHHAGEIGHVPANLTLVAQLNEERPDGLGPLEPHRCSCTPADEPQLGHLESYAAAPALAQRLDPSRPHGEVVRRVLDDPDHEPHRRALEDSGTLVADALVGPLAMLNPASIVLTGALAGPAMEGAMKKTLAKGHRFGGQPTVAAVDDASLNKFIRAKGAALVVLRHHVHRELAGILDGTERVVCDKVRNLTTPLVAHPWEPA